jgi:hypothetical protein
MASTAGDYLGERLAAGGGTTLALAAQEFAAALEPGR